MSLEDELKKRAKQWATEITNRAKANLGNKARLIGIQSRTESVEGGNVSIRVTAFNKESNRWGVIRVARAYEQGSGIHGRRKSTYVIKPRKAKGLLAFYWDVLNTTMEMFGDEGVSEMMRDTPKYVGPASDPDEQGRPRWLFRYVDHPGVEAVNGGKGYMRPAIKSVRAKMNREIRQITKEQVKASIRKGYKIDK